MPMVTNMISTPIATTATSSASTLANSVSDSQAKVSVSNLYTNVLQAYNCVLVDAMQVKIRKDGKTRNYNIKTPLRARIISSYARRCYRTSASGMLNPGSGLSRYILRTISRQIRVEFNNICSTSNKSILQQSNGMLKSFSWEALWSEFQHRVPVLLGLLRSILPKSDKAFLGFVISLLLKKRNQKMSLMQRLVSVLLYGNAAHKQVHFSILCVQMYLNYLISFCRYTDTCSL